MREVGKREVRREDSLGKRGKGRRRREVSDTFVRAGRRVEQFNDRDGDERRKNSRDSVPQHISGGSDETIGSYWRRVELSPGPRREMGHQHLESLIVSPSSSEFAQARQPQRPLDDLRSSLDDLGVVLGGRVGASRSSGFSRGDGGGRVGEVKSC